VKAAPAPTSVPPGLSLPQDFPPLAAPSAPPPIPPPVQRKVTIKNIKAVVPVVPASSVRLAALSKDLHIGEQAATGAKATIPIAPLVYQDNPKNGSSKDGALEDHQESRPAAPSESSKLDKDVTPTANPKAADKKQRPGKIDIAAAKDASDADSTDIRSTVGEATSALGLSQPSTPATAASQPSFSRLKQPRTIRVCREDMLPASPGVLPSAATSRQASRRPSLTSADRPDTPASEKISDNASFTTGSRSRANSPPPSKVGSAPLRQVTKSQQKKERQARAKLAESVAKVEEVPAKVEEVQAPILGRKKKTKKEKAQGTAESTPTVTRPTSPVPKEEALEARVVSGPAPVTPVKESKKNGPKAAPEPDTPSSPATPAGTDQQKIAQTAAAIFASLLKAGEITASAADLFKPVHGINHRFEAIEPTFAATDDSMSDDQARLLEHGEPIHINNGPNNQVIVLPDRRALRGLTAEQAARYLDLRKQALFNGDVPSLQALDGLIPPPPPVDAVLAISNPKGATKNKKLGNPFTAPTGGPEPVLSNAAVLDGTTIEGMVHRQASMSVAEAEQALLLSRKETEILEKKLNVVLKKNRRLLFGNAH